MIRAGISTPTGAINPVTVADQGGLDMLAQTGEYLCLSGQTLNLTPVLATSWSANSTADVWTFKIRQGVKFSNGAALTADDVVYTFKLLTNATNASNSLSAFCRTHPPAVRRGEGGRLHGRLPPGRPQRELPVPVSSDNYNAIIIPNNYNPASWQSTFIGTGPFKLASYTPKVGASFTRNESYWGTKALPSSTQFTFYDTTSASVLALTGGSIDVLGQFSVSGGEALLGGGYNVIKLKSSAHRELSMRNDQAPFTDPRVRQAIALTLNRPQIITALFKGYADIGNDSPFAPVFPSTNTSIPSARRTSARPSRCCPPRATPGFSTQLITERSARDPGIRPDHRAVRGADRGEDQPEGGKLSAYYGKTFGSSDWLDATMSLVDYGHRSVPNVFLGAPLETTNAKTRGRPVERRALQNSSYNSLVTKFNAAVDLSTQRSLAGQIETLLLAQTPIVFGYFYNYLTATAQGVSGVYPTAIGHLFLYNAAKS